MTRIYLIGAGVIARHHAAALAKLPPGVRLIVADSHAAALDAFGAEFPQAQRAAGVAAMLAEPSQPDDVVVVATPPATHAPLARMALESGRHVLCEKPLAMTLAEAEDLLAVARASGKLLGCCSTRFLGLPTTAEVKRLIRDGTLGSVYHLSFVQRAQRMRPGIEYQPRSRWFLERAQSGGGPLMDWGPYDFAMLNDLLDPVRIDVLGAWLSQPRTAADPAEVVFDIEEHVGASLRYQLADGTSVHITYERAACTHGAPRSLVELEGTAGAVSWDWLMWGGVGSLTLTTDRDGQPATTTTELAATERITFQERPLIYFLRQLRGEPAPAVANERAIFDFACIQAIYAAAESGQRQTVRRAGRDDAAYGPTSST